MMSNSKAAIRQAFSLHEEADRFSQAWPPMSRSAPMPTFSWEALERQLMSLAASNETATLVPGLVSATRKLAQWKPPEMVLREILCLGSTVMDRDFPPSAQEGPSMT
jgi:hypothetical protein